MIELGGLTIGMGMREIVLGVVVLISLYLGVTVLRLFFVGGREQPVAVPEPAPVEDEDDALSGIWPSATPVVQAAPVVPEPDVPAPTPSRLESVKHLFKRRNREDVRREPDLPKPLETKTMEADDDGSGVTSSVIDFARELAFSNLQKDVQRLQREATTLREELAAVKGEMAQLKSSRSTSPLYNEAMTMAQRGMEAVSIADRCGISMGEAQLVAALARDKPMPDATTSGINEEDEDEFYTERGYRHYA
jgi:hypothetical protein